MPNSDTPLLSVVCITYNQHDYIRQALEGFIMQRTDFKFEVLINDDASTDGTTEIIREYEAKYPELFRCVYHEKNQWGKHDPWRDFLFPLVRSRYVALCEGDDYWTDPLKLQKQVDFLESHPDFAICFHPVTVHWENGELPDSIFPTEKNRFFKDVLSLQDLLNRNFIQTNSVVYRWRFHQDPLSLIPENIIPGDWFMHLIHAQTGKIGMLHDVMAVYRKNSGGIWTGHMQTPEWFLRCALPNIRFYLAVQNSFDYDCRVPLDRLSILLYISAMQKHKDVIIDELNELYPPDLSMLQYTSLKIALLTILKRLAITHSQRKQLKECIITLKKVKEFKRRI